MSDAKDIMNYYSNASGGAVVVRFENAPSRICARAQIAGPDEDPNLAPDAYASPPCFMHELDPSYLGYLRQEELRDFLARLYDGWKSGLTITAPPGGSMDDIEITAALRSICREDIAIRETLRRQLERLGGAVGSASPAADAGASSAFLVRMRDALVAEARTLLPRIGDDAIRRDLAELVAAHERRAALTAVL